MNKKLIAPVLGCTLSLLLGILTLVLPKEEVSEGENRTLAAAPSLSMETILQQDWMTQWNRYLADHFVGGTITRAFGNHLSLLLGPPKIGEVFVLSDRLVENVRSVNPVTARRNTEAIDAFAAAYPELSVYLALVPTAAEVYRDELPAEPNQLDQLAVINGVYGENPQSQQAANVAGGTSSAYGTLKQASTVDIHTALLANRQQELFYRTDSRWTSLGAFTAYNSLMTGMAGSAISKDLFNIEYVENGYYGDLSRRTLLRRGDGDRIDLYTPATGEVVREVICYNGEEAEVRDSLYCYDCLDQADKTDVFLGEDRGVTVIHTNVDNGRSLLLFGDDYAKPMLQFLSLHYQSITFVDLGELAAGEGALIDPGEYQSVLFLYPVTSYVSDTSISSRLDQLMESDAE